MTKQSLLLAIAFVCVLAGAVYAQETPQPEQTSAPPPSPGLDIQGLRTYLLGPGDVVDVRVFGQPELSAQAQVDSDGNLSALPFLEAPIRAKCRTDKEVQKDIQIAYAKFINNPQVS